MKSSRRELLAGAALGAVALSAGPARAQFQERPRATPGPAPAPFIIGNLPGRRRIDLSGAWRFVIDPYDVARRKPRNRRTFWLDEAETPGGPLIEYEWESSPQIRVPGDWNTQMPEMTWYHGPVYYRRDLPAAVGAVRDGREFLGFEGVNYACTVWMNGEEIGAHEGGFTPFYLEITGKRRGENDFIVVRADSRHSAQSLPSVDFDWQNYGGVTRPVWLLETPQTFIKDAFVRLEGEAIVADVVLDGPSAAGARATLSIPELGFTVRGRTDATGAARLTAPARGLRLWSPEDPTLYEVTVEAAGDAWRDRIGLRRIETRGREILLNGAPVFLRGIAMHEEPIGPDGGRLVDEPAARALLQAAKDLGCNFVRLAHYPHNEHMSRLADEMGLMVWAEIPVYWEDVAYESNATMALARTMMTELILRDRNRASIVMWSVANETPQIDARTFFLETVIADVRRLDPTRLVTAALDKNVDIGGVADGESRISVQDRLGASLDVIAMNQYEGWYGRRMPGEIFDQVSFSTPYEKPLVMSEFGADAPAGFRGERDARWTEDFQAFLYQETLRCIDRDGFVGVIPWLLKDFRSPRRWHGRHQQYWNRKGVISETGVRKQAFEVLRAYYASKTNA